VPPSNVAAVCPVVVTGEVPDGAAVRVLNLDMKKPLAWEGKTCSGVPEIGSGDGL
jgi:hypothetical protein